MSSSSRPVLMRPGGPIRRIQQLAYDGTRLFCPDHPTRTLEEASITGKGRPFGVVCTAPIPGEPGRACMNSAEWPSRQATRDELKANDPKI